MVHTTRAPSFSQEPLLLIASFLGSTVGRRSIQANPFKEGAGADFDGNSASFFSILVRVSPVALESAVSCRERTCHRIRSFLKGSFSLSARSSQASASAVSSPAGRGPASSFSASVLKASSDPFLRKRRPRSQSFFKKHLN